MASKFVFLHMAKQEQEKLTQWKDHKAKMAKELFQEQ